MAAGFAAASASRHFLSFWQLAAATPPAAASAGLVSAGFASAGLVSAGFFASAGLASAGFFASAGLPSAGFFASAGLASAGFFAGLPSAGLAAAGFPWVCYVCSFFAHPDASAIPRRSAVVIDTVRMILLLGGIRRLQNLCAKWSTPLPGHQATGSRPTGRQAGGRAGGQAPAGWSSAGSPCASRRRMEAPTSAA